MVRDENNIAESSSHEEETSTSSPEDGSRKAPEPPTEIGGREGPDPTRYGDWEKNGRCIDF